jgi:predicted O-methyltransferase YrrM
MVSSFTIRSSSPTPRFQWRGASRLLPADIDQRCWAHRTWGRNANKAILPHGRYRHPTDPAWLEAIRLESDQIGFALASEPKTGSLLRTLAASKPSGRFLELGTGTGVGTAWLLAGMDSHSTLISVDTDPKVQEVARRYLGHDSRVTFHLGDGGAFLESATKQFDLIYADAWPGKFTHLDRALASGCRRYLLH